MCLLHVLSPFSLFSVFQLFLPSFVCRTYLIITTSVRQSYRQHFCTSSTFSITIPQDGKDTFFSYHFFSTSPFALHSLLLKVVTLVNDRPELLLQLKLFFMCMCYSFHIYSSLISFCFSLNLLSFVLFPCESTVYNTLARVQIFYIARVNNIFPFAKRNSHCSG